MLLHKTNNAFTFSDSSYDATEYCTGDTFTSIKVAINTNQTPAFVLIQALSNHERGKIRQQHDKLTMLIKKYKQLEM